MDEHYIRGLAKLGYTDLKSSLFVELRIHDISTRYIADLAGLGYKDISPSKLVEMSIHDVSLCYIRQLAELGYDDLTPSTLVEMQIHDVTSSFIKKMQRRGRGRPDAPRPHRIQDPRPALGPWIICDLQIDSDPRCETPK